MKKLLYEPRLRHQLVFIFTIVCSLLLSILFYPPTKPYALVVISGFNLIVGHNLTAGICWSERIWMGYVPALLGNLIGICLVLIYFLTN